MRPFKYSCVALVVFFSSIAYAGQVLGSVTFSGRALPSAGFQITCGGATTDGATASDGSFRINVPQQGQCTFTLVGYAGATAVVFSYPNPSHYDFELVRMPDGNYTLRKR
jgi:hypothetical protein